MRRSLLVLLGLGVVLFGLVAFNHCMKILFLHGMFATPGGTIPTFLRQYGHEVIEPSLPQHHFNESVTIAHKALIDHLPEVVVGVSRGGAVAMKLPAENVPMVLIAPAWNWQPVAGRVKKGTVILHSKTDEVVPFEHTRQLARNSRLPKTDVIVVGENHSMVSSEALAALLAAVQRAQTPRQTP